MGNVIAVQNTPLLQQLQSAAVAAGSKISACAQAALKKLQETLNAVWDGVKHTISFLAHSFEKNENIQTVCKLGKSAIGFATKVLKYESEGLSNLGAVFAGGDTLIDVFGVFGSIKYWVSGEFKNDVEDAPFKVTSKAFSTVSRVIGVGVFLVDVGLVKLGHIADALNTIPFFKVALEFSPVKVVKDTLGLIGAAFSIVDSSIRLHKRRTGNDGEIAELKLWKWELRKAIVQSWNLTPAEKDAQIEKIEKKMAIKVVEQVSYEEKISTLFNEVAGKLAAHGIMRKSNGVVDKHSIKKCDAHLIKKTQDVKAHVVAQHKEWVTIALNVVKIAAIALGLVATFALALSGPVLLGIIGAAWLITSTVGIVKLYHGWRQDKNHENEHKKADKLLKEDAKERADAAAAQNAPVNNPPTIDGEGQGPDAPAGNGDQGAVVQDGNPADVPGNNDVNGDQAEEPQAQDENAGVGAGQIEQPPVLQEDAAQ